MYAQKQKYIKSHLDKSLGFAVKHKEKTLEWGNNNKDVIKKWGNQINDDLYNGEITEEGLLSTINNKGKLSTWYLAGERQRDFI